MRHTLPLLIALALAACSTTVSGLPAAHDADAGVDGNDGHPDADTADVAHPDADATADAALPDVDTRDAEPDADATDAPDSPDTADADAADTADADAAVLPDTDLPDVWDGLTRYPPGRVSSPVSSSVVARMSAIRDANPGADDLVFMKVGASGTVSTNLLYCFAGDPYTVDLDGRDALQDTIDWFLMGDAAGASPFDRDTLAAVSGRTARWAITGSPSPVEAEIDAIHPRFAVVNYGTNDMNQGTTFSSALPGFYDSMSTLLDLLEEQGIIPVITGLNPRSDSASAALWVPTYDAVTRGLAEARQLPFLDLLLAARDLPAMGLLSDGLHGNVFRTGGRAEPCIFTAEALQANYNVRNLLTLGAFDAARRTVLEGAPAPDRAVGPLEGDGSAERPFVIDHLPFTHAADTRRSTARNLDGYPACDTGQNESGPELLYRLTLDAPTPVRLLVLDLGGVDLDIHLLSGDTCVARHDRIIETTLEAGVWTIALDTYVSGSGEQAGEFLFVAVACEPGDPDCQ